MKPQSTWRNKSSETGWADLVPDSGLWLCCVQLMKEVCELVWQRNAETHGRVCARMAEPKLFSVKTLAAQLANFSPQLCLGNSIVAPTAVNLIAHNRMFQPRQVNPNLMRPPRFQLNIKQREPVVSFANPIDRKSRAAAAHHSHAYAIARIASNGLIDLPGALNENSVDQRNVRLKDFARAKLIREFLVSVFGLGDNHQSGRLLVETVHDAGANRACPRRELLKMISKTVGQCARLITSRRMNNHACRFVNNNQIVIFVNDLDWNILWHQRG